MGGSSSAALAGSPTAYSGARNRMPTSFNIAGVFRHAIDLLKSPVQVMNAYRDTDPPFKSILINYVTVLAAIPLVATLIGGLWYYGLYGYLGFVGGTIYGYVFVSAILDYILSIAAVAVVGYVVWKLAPNFGTTTSLARAIRLAAYAFTPYFILSIFNIIPIIGVLSILGLLYGLYILYLGVPILLGTPQDKVLTYVIVTVVAVLVVYAIIDSIAFGVASLAFFHAFGM